MRRTLLAAIAALAVSISPAYGMYGTSRTGTTGAAFLKIAPGARPAAMGEAYAPIAAGAYSVYWNPAGLNFVEEGEVSFMHSVWFQGIHFSHLVYARPMPFLRGSLGAGVTYVNLGSIERVTSAGASEGDFVPYDLAVSLAYARDLFGVKAGLGFKYIYQEIHEHSASALAADIGLRHRMFAERLDLGLAVSNLGSKLGFEKREAELPLIFRAGAGYSALDNLTAAVQLNIPNDNDANIHAGAEYVVGEIYSVPLALRAGYRTNSALEGLSGFSFGFGLSRDNFVLDYALSPYGKLGVSHRVSISLKGI